jgi:tetratricopeptide (TPR) repeat protein
VADVSRRVEMALKKAWTLIEAKQVELGLKAFDDAIAADPENESLLVEKGVALFRSARIEEAIRSFEAALARNAKNAVARANAAKALLQLGRRDAALALYEAGLAVEAESFTLLLGSGVALLELGRADEALARFGKAAAVKPREGEPWYRCGLALRAKGDLAGALGAFAEACGLRPKYTEALRERALTLRSLGRPKEAWPHAVEAVKAAGEGASIELLCAVGDIALDLGQGGDALTCAEKALQKSKESAEAWALKARAQEKLGNAASAALSAGTGHMVAGRLEDALTSLDKAISIDPRYTAGWCNRAVVLERLGRNEDAAKSYERALEIEPGAALVWHNFGNLLYGKLGRKDEALRCFRREVKLDHRRWFDLPTEIRSAVDQLG